jgi:type IV secretion system protein VirB8
MDFKSIFRFVSNSGKSNAQGPVDEVKHEKLVNWKKESYENILIQRNFLIFFTFLLVATVAITVLVIGYIKSTQTIEPFVIEIERKTGVPTVVDPVSVKKYSANQAIKRYYIMKYIRAREEYSYNSFMYNYNTVVRVMSSGEVYYGDYKPKYSPYSQNSIYSLYGANYLSTVSLKSMIFTTANSAQVRIKVSATNGTERDRIVYLEFEFKNVEMSDVERMVNPLGFVVTLYRITDENF